MFKKVLFFSENLFLLNIVDYYGDSEKVLRFFFSFKNFVYILRFNGYIRNEVEGELKLRLQELDKVVLFLILFVLEVLFCVDYLI